MLSKYWSAFLLLALGFAALVDRRRDAYFRSAAPYLTTLVAAAAFAPHAYWLVREHFPPMTWVTLRRVSLSTFEAFQSLAEYSFGTLGYASVAILAVILFVRPSWSGLRDGLAPRENTRRTAAIIFWAAMLIPVIVSFITNTNLLSLWNTPALNLLPVVLLGSPLVTVTRDQVARIAWIAGVVPLLALVASPFVALADFRGGVENYAIYTRELALALDREWERNSDQPLRIVAGPFEVVSSVVMYMPEQPVTLANYSIYLSPWATWDRILREGMIVVCPQADPHCNKGINILTARYESLRTTHVDVTPHWLGLSGAPQRFAVAILPPRP